jgi:mannosyltransferase
MSTTTPPRRRSLTDGWELPELRDVHPPRVVQRLPRWLLGGGVLVVLLLISTYLRTRELGGTLWWGETNAIGIANQSFGGVLHASYVGGSAPLYYLLLHFWTSGVGDSVSAVRDLSLVLALLCVPVAGWAGWSLGGARGAFYGAVLFAFGSMLTEYGQQAQPYSLLILLGLIATTAFLHAFVYRRRAIVRDALLCAGAMTVLFFPWIPATIHQIAHATSPWHYAPVLQSYLPSDLVGSERVDADLLVIGVLAVGPFVIAKSRRRDPDGVALYALVVMVFAAILFGVLANIAAPVLVFRYFAMTASALLLFAALSAARTKIVGLVAVAFFIIFCANPAAFATSHPSNMNEVAAQLGGRLHHGDVVVMAQPEQASLAWYYLPTGVRWASTVGPVKDPRYMDWDDALTNLRHAAPGPTLGHLVASLRPGQQLLYIRPLTEGAKNWESPWASLVQLRAAQWGQLLSKDVAAGTLTQVASAPENYPGDCCVASSAALFRKS